MDDLQQQPGEARPRYQERLIAHALWELDNKNEALLRAEAAEWLHGALDAWGQLRTEPTLILTQEDLMGLHGNTVLTRRDGYGGWAMCVAAAEQAYWRSRPMAVFYPYAVVAGHDDLLDRRAAIEALDPDDD